MLELTDILHIGFAFGIGFMSALGLMLVIGLGLAFFQRKILDLYTNLGNRKLP
jgi:hypothetical protein